MAAPMAELIDEAPPEAGASSPCFKNLLKQSGGSRFFSSLKVRATVSAGS
jgi:hypothetical protein